jgi:hypothetical protein
MLEQAISMCHLTQMEIVNGFQQILDTFLVSLGAILMLLTKYQLILT